MQSREPGRVLVAMSGGVDSSVAAALLVEQGYEVLGVTMQVWDYTSCNLEEGNGTCCSSLDVDDARSVCDRLGIPFYVINCEEKFKAAVIDPFIQSYLSGKTPLPCVNCNTFLKFDHLVQKMRELDCDFLATGHYAKIERVDGESRIVTSTDDWKDQTYFLFTIDPKLVRQLLFPIGHLKKPDVRILAERFGLQNARKKDSTGICFVGNRDYADFIEENIGSGDRSAGWIKKYPTGEQLVSHRGVHQFTYGQRKGLGFAAGEPLFVLKIEPETGTVWVGEEKYLFAQEATVERPHFLLDWDESETFSVKIRFQHKGSPARLRSRLDGKLHVEFLEPVRAVTPGQAAVIYRDRELVGGGWIC